MRSRKIIVIGFSLLLMCSVSNLYAQDLALSRILRSLSQKHVTSLQKLDLINGYRGHLVKGAGKVRDVLKKYGSEDRAIVYVQIKYANKYYTVALNVNIAYVREIKEGKRVSFEGTFDGMTSETIRLEEARIFPAKSIFAF